MATDGTVLKKVTMKSKPLVPKIDTAFTKKMNTTDQKVTITANWKKDPAVKKYLIKITLDNGKSIVANSTDPNFSIITDETNGATLTITAVAKNNLTSKVSRKI
jgi:K+ transporter